MSFEWRTDEDRGWDPRPPAPGKPRERLALRAWRAGARLFRRHRRALLSGLLLFLAAGALGFRALTLRIEAAENARIAEVRAAHGVLLDAVATNDAELYLTMLTPDRSWRQTQLALFEQNAVFRRDAMGLEWQPELEPATEIALSPDLQQAVVTSTLHYLGYTGSSDSQRVALQHVLHFINDGAQWRLARHDDDFWGGWVTDDQDEVLFAFPQRDTVLGGRLADDLNERMETICIAVATCPPISGIQVRLERIPDTLAAPVASLYEATERFTVELPAPSLVGIPVDETAYQALLDGYTRQIVGELLAYFVPDVWLASGAYSQALRQGLFVYLGLEPWPPAQIRRSNVAPDFAQDILTLCADGVGEGATLWRYQSDTAGWAKEFEGWNVTNITDLDGAPGIVLQAQELGAPEPEPAIAWWRNGQVAAIFEGLYLGETASRSPTLDAWTPEQQPRRIWLGNATNCDGQRCLGVVILDVLATWSPDGRHTLFRRVFEDSRSSPAFDGVLWLGDGNGSPLRRVGDGFNEFWIDDDTFGYLAIPAEPQGADELNFDVIVHELGRNGSSLGDGEVILTTEAMKDFLPSPDGAQRLGMFISYVLVHPARPQTIFVVGSRFESNSDEVPQHSMLMSSIDRQSGEATLRISTEQVQWTSVPHFSPDGRWLAYTTYDPLTREGMVEVNDLDEDSGGANPWQHTFVAADDYVTPTFEWSRNGNLLLMEQGIIHVIEPETWTEWQIVPPVPACSQSVWADS